MCETATLLYACRLPQPYVSQVLAQLGANVPAAAMTLTCVDRIFTRIGASDQIAAGLSTFQVEMIEAGVVLRDATPASLVLLDELGRGTATHDGVAVATAVFASVVRELRCAALLSTHYDALVADCAAGSHGAVQVAHMATRTETDGEDGAVRVTPLYTLTEGPCWRSHGVACARAAFSQAGLPTATANALLCVAEARSAALQQHMCERLLLGLARAVLGCRGVHELAPLQRRVSLLEALQSEPR